MAVALTCAALIAICAAPVAPAARTYYVSASRGSDAAKGSARAPWRSIARANRVAPGSTVRVAAGKYDDAPVAPGVIFRGRDSSSPGERIVDRTVALTGRGTQIIGFTLEHGLDLSGGARDIVVDRCVIEDHWGVWGSRNMAPRNNRISNTRMRVREMAAHNFGDDRERGVARITGLTLVDCDVTVKRSHDVLWRWSGVDDAKIIRTTIRLVNGGDHNDDNASWKWLHVRRAQILDSRIVLDNAGDFGGTGPFAPMWRDSTWGIRMVRTTIEATRGGFIFSPNTAGTWICSCGGHRFENVVLRAPGTILLYQCPRQASDVWVNSRVYAGRLDKYNTGRIPAGLAVKRYSPAPAR